jgi:hypothetical protein
MLASTTVIVGFRFTYFSSSLIRSLQLKIICCLLFHKKSILMKEKVLFFLFHLSFNELLYRYVWDAKREREKKNYMAKARSRKLKYLLGLIALNWNWNVRNFGEKRKKWLK